MWPVFADFSFKIHQVLLISHWIEGWSGVGIVSELVDQNDSLLNGKWHDAGVLHELLCIRVYACTTTVEHKRPQSKVTVVGKYIIHDEKYRGDGDSYKNNNKKAEQSEDSWIVCWLSWYSVTTRETEAWQ